MRFKMWNKKIGWFVCCECSRCHGHGCGRMNLLCHIWPLTFSKAQGSCYRLHVCHVKRKKSRKSKKKISRAEMWWGAPSCCCGRAQGPSSSRFSHHSSIIKCTQTVDSDHRQGVAVWGRWRERRLGAWAQLRSLSKLSCKTRAGISCNSLSNAERGEGWKDAEFAGSLPKSGRKNEFREHRERALTEGGERGKKASICTLQACAAFWLYTKAALNTKRNCLSVHFFQGPNCCRYVKPASVCCCGER